MNLVSFIDELVKLGAARSLIKRAGEADATSNVNSSEPPATIMGGGAVPMALRVVPEKASTRLPDSVDVPSQIVAGSLGDVSGAKYPIDRDKFNRWYRDKR
jgi:hypothetical protein